MVYIELYHGRKDPRQDMDDWGEQGPVLGPFEYVHITYASDIKLGGGGHIEFVGPEEDLVKELVYYDGVFYGDISTFGEEMVSRYPELKARVQKFDEAKAVPPAIEPTPQAKYVKAGGAVCPACGSEDIEGGFIEVDGPAAWQPITCNTCGSGWNDIYKLICYEDLDDLTKEGSATITCPACGYEEEEQVGFSLLAAGFNGIKKGDPDDIDRLECGKCGAKFDHKMKEDV